MNDARKIVRNAIRSGSLKELYQHLEDEQDTINKDPKVDHDINKNINEPENDDVSLEIVENAIRLEVRRLLKGIE